jgi:hypothetical protein
MKHFRVEDRLVETRLLVRHTGGGWAGYSYEWNAEQTDATLLEDGKIVQLEHQSWLFPSRANCLTCHTAQAGYTLGPEVLQLNASPTEVGPATSQLEQWEADGLFSAPLSSVFDDDGWVLPALSDASVPAQLRAHGYLHANCSFCHRPGGVDVDFRFTADDASYCGVQAETARVNGATLLIDPDDPPNSVILARMRTTNPQLRMPPLATSLVDDAALTVAEEWVQTACP